jgi:hypothetical protein
MSAVRSIGRTCPCLTRQPALQTQPPVAPFHLFNHRSHPHVSYPFPLAAERGRHPSFFSAPPSASHRSPGCRAPPATPSACALTAAPGIGALPAAPGAARLATASGDYVLAAPPGDCVLAAALVICCSCLLASTTPPAIAL